MPRTFNLASNLILAVALGLSLIACGGGGGGGGTPAIDAGTSTVTATPGFGAIADGTDIVVISATLLNTKGNVAANRDVVITVSGNSNTVVQAAAMSDANGQVTATLVTTVAEEKTVTVTIGTGNSEVVLDSTPTVEFLWPSAQTFFVRSTGNDSNLGDSPNRAWATIGFAASQVVPGDNVFIGGGTYPESITVTRSGTIGDEIFFVADRTGVFTGVAGEVLVDGGGADHSIRVNGASDLVFSGLVVTGATPAANAGGGYSINGGATRISLLDTQAYGNDRGIWIDNATSVTVNGLIASNNSGGDGEGVSVRSASNVSITNAKIYNNSGYGLHVRSSVTNVTVNVCTFYLNGDDHVRADGGGSGNTGVVRNSILTMGLADGLDFAAGTGLTQRNNAFNSNTGSDYVVGGSGQALADGSFSSDPLHADPDGLDNTLGGAAGDDDNFSVADTSLTIDAGDDDAKNTTLSFGGGALTGGTTRTDSLLDGTLPDGSTVNLGFHLLASSDPLNFITNGDGRLFFGRGNNVQVFGRAWLNESEVWESTTLTDPAIATVKWVRNEVSPINSREELLAIFSDTGTETELSVRLWNGRFWAEAGGTTPIDSQILSANADQRAFDIAYEHLSGQPIVVYSDNTNNPVYRTFTLGVWSEELPVFNPGSPGTGEVLWVELANTEVSNEIAMVALTTDENLISCVWNGNSWDQTTAELLDTSIAVLTESRGFDVAYEQSSGDLLIAWGKSLVDEQLDYAVLPSGTSSYVFSVASSIDAVGGIVRMASEPGTDRIVLGVSEGIVSNGDAVAGIWTGIGFNNIVEVELNTGADDAKDCEVAWVGTSGIAIFIWKGNDGGGSIDWARFRSTGWQLQTDEPFAGIGDMEFIHASSFPGDDQVMVLLSDETGSLYGMTYDGTTWTFTNSGVALESNLSDLGASSQPFSFSFKP
ncbi:MAG: hypothetical protein ACI8QS_000659 [Planctomycetota bacterium]|jgi:hypothetical protein